MEGGNQGQSLNPAGYTINLRSWLLNDEQQFEEEQIIEHQLI
jgi:hypothetical protein